MGKQNEKNYLRGRTPNKQKKNKEMFLGFLFSATSNYSRKKIKKKMEIFLDFLKFFKHTRRKRENKFNMDNTMKKCEHQTWNEMCKNECNVGGKHVLPQAWAFGLTW